MDNPLSERGKVSRDWEDFLYKDLAICSREPYDENDNPSGYVNFNIAVNYLCDDIIHPRLKDVWTLDVDFLGYKEGRGSLRLRKAIAKLMTEFHESYEPISPGDLFCLTGVTSCIDLLGHCLADPGEVFLVPTPMYGRISTDFNQRSLVKVWPVHVITEDEEDHPELTMDKIVYAYESALASNEVVRGIFLINPNNPLGDIYSPKLLMDIMAFCKTNFLHIIVDEIYALSVFSKTERFHSILKFDHVPDPDRTHVLYGLSKDFGVAGLKVGVIHTKCKQLQKSLIQLSYFQNIPYPLTEIAANFIEDLEWCKKYINIHRKRLAQTYEYCVKYLESIGLKVRDSPAGFFLWVDLRDICGSSFEEERDLYNYLMDKNHLSIGPGKEFHCAQPGWFRIVFTQRLDYLKEGLRRLAEGLKNYKPSKDQIIIS